MNPAPPQQSTRSPLSSPSSPPPDSLLATLRTFPRPVWILFGGVFLNKFGTFVVPFLTIYLTRRGFTNAEAGLAFGAYGLGRIAAAILGGQLADSIGRRKTILVSMTLAAVSMVLLSRANNLATISFFTALASLTGEMYLPACAALLADLTPEHQRVTAFATYRMAFNAGWAFGPAVAAFLVTHSLTWLFWGDALSSLLFAVIAWRWLPRGIHRTVEAGWTEALVVLRRDGRFQQVALATFLIGLVIHQTVSTYGLQITSWGLEASVYGKLLSFNGLVVMLFELPWTRVTGRFRPRLMIAAGYIFMGGALAMLAVVHTVPSLYLGMALLTLGEMTFAPVAGAYVTKLAPPVMRGRYMGGWGMANSLSLALAPTLGMALFSYNPPVLWVACGATALVAALVMVLEPRRVTRGLSVPTALPTSAPVPAPIGQGDGNQARPD
ncbi:MAG TPA: MFS transporter [Verrucomicrobiae bacterium]|jgi:MFS family permease|nr:MFS transporter [Verrucomicrobiae bacterium]